MKWESVKRLKKKEFKRLVGVDPNTFNTMVSEIKKLSEPSKHKISGKKRGPKPKLSKEDELLMLLMYYQEYRTFFHIGADYHPHRKNPVEEQTISSAWKEDADSRRQAMGSGGH